MMGADTDSGWFILKAGFKVHGRCPTCNSSNISYYKDRRDGLKGISHLSTGLKPVCLDCGHGLPKQTTKPKKKSTLVLKPRLV